MTKKPSIADQLRSELAINDGHQTELRAERDELSYLALVDRRPQAIQRLAAINEEIGNLTTQAQTIEPALKEALRREGVAREQAAVEKRRDDARKADTALTEAEEIAKKFDEALLAVRANAVAFEAAMIKVRQLTGTSPRYDAIRVFMFRAVRTALFQTPVHVDSIAPAERTTLSEASASWSRSIRGWLASVLDKTTAKRAA
jgi:hypothetical protein